MNLRTLGTCSIPRVCFGAVLFLLACTSAAQSSLPEGGGIRVSGFGTLGIVHAQAPEGWGFLRDVDQPAGRHTTRVDTDSRLGLQLNYTAHPRVELVGQLLLARRASGAPATDAIEWAFAAYRPNVDLTLRAGRLNLDQFVMSDFRNVGFAYLYARPPVEYYGSIPSNLDGADATQIWHLGDARWRAKAYVGSSKTNGIPLHDAYGVSLDREAAGLLLRAGWSRVKLAHNIQSLEPVLTGLTQLQALPIPTVAAQAQDLYHTLDLAAEPLTYTSFGLSYEQPRWQFAAEFTRITIGVAGIRAGYASVGRRVGSVTWYALASHIQTSTSSPPVPAWGATLTPLIGPVAAQQAQMLGAAAAYAAGQSPRQSALSLGARWDIHARLALKVQWDHVKVRANGGFLWARASDAPARADISTVLLDFVF